MSPRKSRLALVLAGAFTIGAAGQAQASAYGGSTLEINNLTILITESVPAPSPNVTINSFLYTATNTASLNGPPVSSSATCGGIPGIPGVGTNNCNVASPHLDPAPANAPGGTVTRTNNTFNFFGPGVQQYSNSDSVIYTSQLTGDTSARTQQIAESEVQAAGSGAANAEIQSTTGFTFNFTISGAGTNELYLNFEGTPYLRAALADPNFLNGSAQANINASFTLTQDSTGLAISWSPQGTAGNNCDSEFAGITCAELADGVDLNRNVSVSSNGADSIFNPGKGLFGLQISGLTNGNWTLALNAVTSTQVRLATAAVPEPGVLSLLGLGLAGLGLARFRRARA